MVRMVGEMRIGKVVKEIGEVWVSGEAGVSGKIRVSGE